MDKRIDSLDGLRGIAVLMVICFHAFSRWGEVLRYGDRYDYFSWGMVGVELFFIISGFVIFITLERTSNFKVFLFKRWLRLFPAMLVATLIIFFTAPFFFERPQGNPVLLNLLPGLTFIEPDWWSIVLGKEVTAIEGSFWTLYVEMKFYIFAAVIYYWKGREALFKALVGVSLFAIIIHNLDAFIQFTPLHRLEQVSDALSFDHFGWFAVGACFYEFHKTEIMKWYLLGAIVAVLNSITFYNDVISAMLVIILFSLSLPFCLKNRYWQKILQTKLLLFLGLVSYPLYLLHENMMISIIIKLDKLQYGLPSFFLPVIAVIFISTLAYIIVKIIEPLLIKQIKRLPITLAMAN